MKTKKICNLGCGRRLHPDCVNVDLAAHDPQVISHNLLHPLPFQDASFEMVYHSHVLEHFEPGDGVKFLSECGRVLKSGCVIRIAVPDLEGIAHAYLAALNHARETGSLADLQWMQLEMFDQMVRRKSGGEMGKWFARKDLSNKEFVIARMGREVEGWIGVPGPRTSRPTPGLLQKIKRGFSTRMKGLLCRWLGVDEEALKFLRFRRTGENHLSVYDEVSLSAVLRELGFVDIVRRDATTSFREDWARYELDADLTGQPHKPDSLFMEARKA